MQTLLRANAHCKSCGGNLMAQERAQQLYLIVLNRHRRRLQYRDDPGARHRFHPIALNKEGFTFLRKFGFTPREATRCAEVLAADGRLEIVTIADGPHLLLSEEVAQWSE